MNVLKFGGTSVGSVESIRAVLDILRSRLDQQQPIAAVFSAMGGFTNQLLDMGQRAAGGEDYHELSEKARKRHLAVVDAFIEPRTRGAVTAGVLTLFMELDDVLRGISLLREFPPAPPTSS